MALTTAKALHSTKRLRCAALNATLAGPWLSALDLQEWATYLNDFASRAAGAQLNGDVVATQAGAGAGAGAGASTDVSSTKSQPVPAGGIAVSDLRDICSLHYLPWSVRTRRPFPRRVCCLTHVA